MNPGPAEEAGKVANNIVDALKGQPLAVALILINLVYIAAGFFIWHQSSQQRVEFVNSIIKQCFERPTTSSGMSSGVK